MPDLIDGHRNEVAKVGRKWYDRLKASKKVLRMPGLVKYGDELKMLKKTFEDVRWNHYRNLSDPIEQNGKVDMISVFKIVY